ncbi:MAG: hypothetical protein ACM3JB_06960 [Acidobacteriaceae bacterium]
MYKKRQHDKVGLRKTVACVAVLAFVFLTIAELVHVHKEALGRSDQSRCSLCVAAHSAASPTAVATATVVFSYAATPEPEKVPSESRFLLSAFFIRPPPAAL